MRIELQAFTDLADLSTQYSLDPITLIAVMKILPRGAEQTTQLKIAFANSIRIIWAVMCALAGVGMIASWFVKSFTLNQAIVTEQAFAKDKKVNTSLAVELSEQPASDMAER
jgi:hypothetical protein